MKSSFAVLLVASVSADVCETDSMSVLQVPSSVDVKKHDQEVCRSVEVGHEAPIDGMFIARGSKVAYKAARGDIAKSAGRFCVDAATVTLLQRAFSVSHVSDFDVLLRKKRTKTEAPELGESLASSFGGDKMERQFIFYNELPVGEDALKAANWTKHDGKGCDPDLGFGWTEDESGVTKKKPLKLYTTAGGQPSGVGVVILSHNNTAPLPGPQQQWATPKPLVPGVEGSHVDVAFRSGGIMCSGAVDSDKIGNVLVVNPKGTSKHIPLTEDGVRSDGWRRGSCFDGMGWHNFLDTSLGNGQMSWKADNLFPVTTMYHEGKLNAIFFTSTVDQVSIPRVETNGWEPKSLTESEMCQNTCDSDCRFDGLTSAGPFSTMHIYFRDHTGITCDKGLTCAAKLPGSGDMGGNMACCASKAAEGV